MRKKKKKYSAKEVFEEILKEFWERLSKKVSNHQNNIILKVKKSQKILGCIHKKAAGHMLQHQTAVEVNISLGRNGSQY